MSFTSPIVRVPLLRTFISVFTSVRPEKCNTDVQSTVLTALSAACIQQPTPGNTISIQGSLFSTTAVNVTSPTPSAAGFVPRSGLTLGAKIGIAVGAILVLLFVLGTCIIWNGKRRRRAILQRVQEQSGYNDWRRHHDFSAETGLGGPSSLPRATPPMSSGAFFDSPDSQRPLHSWAARPGEDESPASGFGEKAYFSPYSSQYSSPVSAHDQIAAVGREWPVERRGSVHDQAGAEWPIERKGSIHDHATVGRDWSLERKTSFAGGSGKVRSRSREKGREADQFEMQNVAPVLLHPGHGRGGSVGLTEEDAKRGAAL